MVSQKVILGRLLAVAVLLFTALSTAASLKITHSEAAQRHAAERELLYMPNGKALALVSVGYQAALSHLLWFQTVNYFGKHYASDKNYRWLAHMCDLVTTLSPASPHVYQFCSNMLSWEANTPEQAVKVLDKAIQNLPNDWKFPYLRGVIYLYFLKNNELARGDFVNASRLPNAHPIVKRLAAKTLAQAESPETAIEFLEEMIRNESDSSARKVLEQRRDEIRAGVINRAKD